ncbi:flagellar basal body rod protein FlgF [Paludibacterium yongneupense]|uniref:flagellar basal body rod protein FlgF n=1 Tax=Paludibacterium yongneupense TaxID=400061 RepID=UPI000414BFCF|nr:flagellar basal body rod protein FlgF [Paludibacterium yongneupense]
MLFLAMGGAKQAEWQQATTSNNMANASTNGFKADQVSFRALPAVGQGAPTRVFVADNTVGQDMSQGALERTGNAEDFALVTPGFFAVQSPDGSEAYTRSGGYVLDNTGMMRTRGGLPIIGSTGAPITVPLGQKIEIGSNGAVMATSQTGAPAAPLQVGQIKLVNPGTKAVYKGGDGLFHLNVTATAPAGSKAPVDPTVQLVSGNLESSNVNVVDSLVQMISHSRMFDLNTKLMTTADQDDRQATELLTISG